MTPTGDEMAERGTDRYINRLPTPPRKPASEVQALLGVAGPGEEPRNKKGSPERMDALRQVVALLESINTDPEVQGAINFLVYGDARGYIHEPLYKSRQNEHELKAQLEEALSIIDDLAELHDSYIGYLVADNNYNEQAARAISERIQILRLKQ